MKASLLRRMDKLEELVRERVLNHRAREREDAIYGFQVRQIFFPKYTVEQQEVVDQFRLWFDQTYPRYPSPDPFDGCPTDYNQATIFLATDEFEEWLENATDFECGEETNKTFRHLIDGLSCRILTEVALNLVPIDQRRYFFDPDEWIELTAFKVNEFEWYPYKKHYFSLAPIRRPVDGKRLQRCLTLAKLLKGRRCTDLAREKFREDEFQEWVGDLTPLQWVRRFIKEG